MSHLTSSVQLISLLFLLIIGNTVSVSIVQSRLHKIRMEDEKVVPQAFDRFPQMWEYSTRSWLYSLSQKNGRNISMIKDIPFSEFESLKAKGIDVVWLMGLWQLGAHGLHYDQTNPGNLENYARHLPGYQKADIIGSPYAVYEYNLNPSLGSLEDLVALKKRLNSIGLKLMTDFVPNHSAVDAPIVSQRQEFFIRAPKDAKPPFDSNRYYSNGLAYGSAGWWGSSWMDTLQFNYWNMETRKQQTQMLLKVASVSDYIRCDMAYLVLNEQMQSNWGNQLSSWGYTKPSTEYWPEAIKTVKETYPGVKFLAEVYEPWGKPLQDFGFDYTYDKHFYDILGHGNLDNIRSYIANTPLDYLERGAHFVDNHDEPRAAAFFGSNMRADGAAMVALTLPGMRFYNEGQQDGLRNRLLVQLRRSAPEQVVIGVPEFYQKLTTIVARPVFHTGKWTYLNVHSDSSSWRLMAWKWTSSEERIAVVINYSDHVGSGAITLQDAQPINGNDTIPVTDLLSGQTWHRSAHQIANQGLFAIIQPWSCQIFKYF